MHEDTLVVKGITVMDSVQVSDQPILEAIQVIKSVCGQTVIGDNVSKVPAHLFGIDNRKNLKLKAQDPARKIVVYLEQHGVIAKDDEIFYIGFEDRVK